MDGNITLREIILVAPFQRACLYICIHHNTYLGVRIIIYTLYQDQYIAYRTFAYNIYYTSAYTYIVYILDTLYNTRGYMDVVLL